MALQYGAGIFGIKTPEFGISEKLSDLLGKGRNSQGGSSLFGSSKPAGSVLGASSYSTPAPPSSMINGPVVNQPSGTSKIGSSGLLSSPSGGQQPSQTYNSSFDTSPLYDAAQSGYDSELSAANSALDYERGNLLSSLDSLGRQKADSLSSLETDLKGINTEVGAQKTRSQQATDEAIGQAGSIARTTQAKNRNVLRALGILNSSAAGTELSKPINEFDQERARLVRGNLDRIKQLDDFYLQKVDEGKQAAREIDSQYTDLVGRIQNDLRFNDRQRTQAVKDATAALNTRKSEIATTLVNYQNQVKQLKGNFAAQLAELKLAADPTADPTGIMNTGLSLADRAYGSDAQIYGGEDQRKRLSGLGL